MTGTSPRKHGLRHFQEEIPFPDFPTMAQCFRDAGYQAYAVGKMHVSPQRNRIGFDDILLEEQGRHQFHDIPDGSADDYELYLQEQGYAGLEYAGGMTQNEFVTRTWHLPEHCHPVNWATREMCKAIRRRDPRKPGFWYLSFSAPHPPLTPLPAYMDLYRDVTIDDPATGDWSADFDSLPYYIKLRSNPDQIAMVRANFEQRQYSRKAFYATITHIDHQIRVVIGYLREAGLLDDTIICFTADHGHMAGEHGLWCMTPFYEMCAKIPLLLVPREGDGRVAEGFRDPRIAEYGDIMPTLLQLAGIPVPNSVDRLSLIGSRRREYLYGEHGVGKEAMRMIRAGSHKLIYYPVGNRFQLFDIDVDPREQVDLSTDQRSVDTLDELKLLLKAELYGDDLAWLRDGEFVGLPDEPYLPKGDRTLFTQRGLRFL